MRNKDSALNGIKWGATALTRVAEAARANALNGIKWGATALIIVANAARAFEYHNIDLITGAIGTFLWLVVAYRMRESSLFLVNAVCLGFLLYGVAKIVV
jgi:hypothetical protein